MFARFLPSVSDPSQARVIERLNHGTFRELQRLQHGGKLLVLRPTPLEVFGIGVKKPTPHIFKSTHTLLTCV